MKKFKQYRANIENLRHKIHSCIHGYIDDLDREPWILYDWTPWHAMITTKVESLETGVYNTYLKTILK